MKAGKHPKQALLRGNSSVKLFAIAKDEGAYLGDWIFHHLDLGFEEVEIWTNGCSDNSNKIVAKIAKTDSRVKLVDASAILEACTRAECRFQILAYETAFKSAKASRRFTHIMFLDIDEYLVSITPNASISQLLREYEQADVISFLWYSDTPNNDKHFRPAIEVETDICRMTHVKSVAKLDSGKVSHPLCHNFKAASGQGEPLNILIGAGQLDKTNSLHNRQVIIPEKFNLNPTRPQEWIVLHRIYRSEVEYCASLLRGRRHENLDLPLKNNRPGYRMSGLGKEGFSLILSSEDIRKYHRRRIDFAKKHGLHKATKKGEKYVLRRFRKLKRMLNKDPNLFGVYSQQLSGTRFEQYDAWRNPNSLSPEQGKDNQKLASYEQSRFKIAMPEEESSLLKDIYQNHARAILEYGTGGSTIFGLCANKIVIGAETDNGWLDTILEEAEKLGIRKGFHPCHMEIGETGALGYPAKEEKELTYGDALQFSKACAAPWITAKMAGVAPNVILVDGRFRASAFITSLALSKPGTLIIFDDYLNRPHYRPIESLLKPERYVGRMAVFKRPTDVDLSNVFDMPMIHHFLDPR